MIFRTLAIACALVTCATASAQMNPPVAAQTTAICQQPEVQRAWSQPALLALSVPDRHTAIAPAKTEQPYRVDLAPCAASTESCSVGSHAALVRIDVPQAGRYRIAVDQMIWIDMFGTAGKREGLMCEHGGCAPVRKIIQYELEAGPNWLGLQGKAPGSVGFVVTAVGR